MSGFVQLDVEVTGSLDRLERALRGLDGPNVQRTARTAARKAVRPAVEGIQAAARGLPARGPATTGLRSSIAAATGTSVTASGVRVRVNSAQLGSRRVLPAKIDSGSFRHPVFGDRSNWVTQTFPPGFFSATFNRYRAPIRTAVLDGVTDAVAAEIGAI